MDAAVLAALAKWPDVPAAYGWVALDARGRWRLGQHGGEPVRHAGLADFLGRNYAATADGAWYVQNGPQRAYVDLAVAPWAAWRNTHGDLVTHTGKAIATIAGAVADDVGHLLLCTEHGLAVADHDLAAEALDTLVGPDGRAAGDATLAALLAGEQIALRCRIDGQDMPLEFVAQSRLPQRFGFIATPRSDAITDHSS